MGVRMIMMNPGLNHVKIEEIYRAVQTNLACLKVISIRKYFEMSASDDYHGAVVPPYWGLILWLRDCNER